MSDTNASIAAPSRTSSNAPAPFSAKTVESFSAPAADVAVPTTK